MDSSRMDLELLQTQSSLLIAHAQIERQKLELRASGVKLLKRPHSFHGLDLLDRKVHACCSIFRNTNPPKIETYQQYSEIEFREFSFKKMLRIQIKE